MVQQIINVGSSPNDSTGDPIRTAFQKVNSNFNEVYANVVGSNFKFQVNTMTTKLGNVNISPVGTNAVVVGTNNQLFVSNTAPATDEYTGALVVAGGVGILGDLYIGGTLNVPAATFGSLENTAIGTTTPAAGTFTQVNVSNISTDSVYVTTQADIFNLAATSINSDQITSNLISVQDTIFANTAVIDNVQITGGNISGVNIVVLSIEDTAIGTITPNTGTFSVMTTSNAQITGGDISGVNLAIGAINGTPIGNATPDSGVFTTLSATTGYTGNVDGDFNGTVGASTPNTGVFTTLTATTGYTGKLDGDFDGTVGAAAPNTGVFTTLTATTGYTGKLDGDFDGTVGAAAPNSGVFTTLTATTGYTGNVDGDFNGTVGATTPNTGVFTTLTATTGYTGNIDGVIGSITPNIATFTDVTINGNLIATGFDIQGNITGSAASASSATTAGSATYASTAGLATAATTVVQPYQGNITGLGILDNLQVTGTSYFSDDVTISADLTSNGYTSFANVTAVDCFVSNIEVFGGNLTIANDFTIGSSIGSTGDFKGKITWDSSYIYVCTADYDGASPIWVRANLSTF